MKSESMLNPHLTINCAGHALDLSEPKVMGILNVTPDSFFEGSRVSGKSAMLRRVEEMLKQGAAVIDIGGMSTRPGASRVGEGEEKARVLPAVEAISRSFPEAILSVDTVRPTVAREAVAAGAGIVNDISAGRMSERMYETIAELQVPYVLMHMQGEPQNMQRNPQYENVVLEVLDFFIRETGRLRDSGVSDIIIDVGFGFGKTLAHNYELLKKMHVFRTLDLPLLTGLSRKSMVCRLLGVSPAEALNGTTALHMVALQQGASLLRVHDVREAVEVIQVWQELGNVKS